MVSVSPEMWGLLDRARRGGSLGAEFDSAWANGEAFLSARDALRGRRPMIVEWKGSHRAPGDEVAPIDLRIDHVFLVSCKYLSKIMINASPAHLFERLLAGGHGVRSGDWYSAVAPAEYQRLYEAVRAALGMRHLPAAASDLTTRDRRDLARTLKLGWPNGTGTHYEALSRAVADRTASRWQERIREGSAAEPMLWRLLRMGSAPYFVLGASTLHPIRLRIATPWDWRINYQVTGFTCTPQLGGQPRVGWSATVLDRHSSVSVHIDGHVEIRWSHGRFGGHPEAKLYLDTPHNAIPGYVPL